jgi:hypothetical protein
MTPTTIVFIVLMSLLRLAPSQLHVNLVFSGLPMRPSAHAAAMCEVRRIWSGYGVDVRELTAREAAQDEALTLSITLSTRDERGDLHTLGVTQFVGGHPMRSIVMYPNAIAALLSSPDLAIRGCIKAATACQDAINGRVFGRALAHELGHYLLESRGHSRSGLMRASPPAEALVEAGTRGFGLSAEDVTHILQLRLQARR